MNWITLRQLLYRQLHQEAATVPTGVKNDVGIAICEAIKFNRNGQYYFNTARVAITSVADQYDYKLPSDYISLIGPIYYTPDGANEQSRYAMMEATVDEIEEEKYAGNDYQTYPHSGRPLIYAVDMSDMRLLVAPIPSQSGDTFDFRYQKDIGTPEYAYDGTNWIFYEGPGKTSVIGDTSVYTSGWFNEGSDLTLWRALYFLWGTLYGGTDESNAKAQQALMSWQEAKMRLMNETTKRMSKRVVRKYI